MCDNKNVRKYRIQKGDTHMTVQELQAKAAECASALESAIKAFEAGRGSATVTELVKLGQAVTSATRSSERSTAELANFELIGIYENVKAQVLKLGDKLLTAADIETLMLKGMSSVTITLPLTVKGIDPERISVNTLGKRTKVASGGGNGTRARWEMRNTSSGEAMECRAFLEAHGDEAFGADAKVTAAMVLNEPARYGLSDYAARAGAKLTPEWERVRKDE